jgi:hypothetical protein
MISVKNILTIAGFESKVLWRNWFFRIVSLAGIFFLTIFYLAEFSALDNPQWELLLNGWMLPYVGMIFICVPQAAAVIFLATGLVKKDKKLDTNEVFFVRPISNIDYVLGKALALFKLFLLLNFVLLCIPLIIGLTNPLATVNPMAFFVSPLITSVPSIIFTTGISFLLVTIIRNQPISIVLLIGAAGVQLIYYFDKFSNILDFSGFRLSMLASEMTGFVDIEFALWQRTFYVITGVGFLFITAFLLDRLAGRRSAHRATGLVGVLLLVLSSFIMLNLWTMRQGTIELRQQMIVVNGKWTTVPNVEVRAHAIALEWAGDEISSVSDMRVVNNTGQVLDTIYFSLNPDLTVDNVLINNKQSQFNRDLQIVSVDKDITVQPGQELSVRIEYHGGITDAAAHLEVDQKRYEDSNDFIIFALKKKYAFVEEDYLLLTKDVSWYPESEVGYNTKAATREKQSFIDFTLTVKAPAGTTAISQGKMELTNNVFHFTPEYPLPQISLVIGDYLKKEVIVDSVTYSVFHYPKNDFFARQLNQLGDTVSYLVKDLADEYEDAQRLSYPFKRMQFVEVPLHFAAYNKIYESYQAFVQPETIYWPEEGGEIRQFDFRRQLRDMDKQAAKANQVLTDKQKQANVFNDLVRKVFTKQIGESWIFEGQEVDRVDYSVFPNYYDFNSGIVSKDWALLNRSISTYLRNDKQTMRDYSREINGISFSEECNDLMRTSSLTKILTQSEFGKINKSIALKSEYLFSYLGHTIGETTFKSFLYDWVNSHQHKLSTYDEFRKSMMSRFQIDIDPVIREVYAETSQPAFEILDVQKYEVMDGDRKRYQVLVKAKNSGNSDGVFEVKFNSKDRFDDDENYGNVNQEAKEEAPGKLSVIKEGETKLFGYVLDEKPIAITINTIISRNIPSVINMSLGTLAKREGGILFDGERVVEKENDSLHYEVIVDNEDPGFSSFSPIKPTLLKAYIESQKEVEQKYYGEWDSSYSSWLATTGSDFFGSVIRSAHFTRSGNGEKLATWTPQFKEEGFYDIYVYMRGKNQNTWTGNQNEGRQFDYHYIINGGDGTDEIKYNVTNAEPGWNYLGSYYFNKTGGSVSLTDKCDLWTVYADAVKFVKQ